MSRIARIDDDLYKEIKKLQKEMIKKYSINISLVKASKAASKLLKEKRRKKEWRFPDFS